MSGNTKPVELGCGSASDLRAELLRAGISKNAYAETLLADAGFHVSTHRHTVRVVSLRVVDLEFDKPPILEAILARLPGRRLAICPLELAPRLILQSAELAREQRLTVPSPRLHPDEAFPAGFYLQRREGQPWLRGYVASDDYAWSLDEHMLFRVVP